MTQEAFDVPEFLPDPRVARFEWLVTADEDDHRRPRPRRFDARAPVPSTVEEHCQECAAPECYATCPLYVEDSRVGCRRLPSGIGWGIDQSGDERIRLELAPLARLKFKAELAASRVWRQGFLLQFASDPGAHAGSVVVQISRSPWTPAVPGLAASVPLQDGWNELLVNASDLSFLRGEGRVEASVLFTEYVGGIEIATANFVEGVDERSGWHGSTVSPRILFTDLDGTLWRGTSGEGSIIPRTEARQALEQFRQMRVEVVAVTRATAAAALAGITAAELDGLISEVIVVAPSAAKAEVLTNWLHAHRRGVDESIFADDDPAERWEARTRLPGLLVLDERELCVGTLHPAVAPRLGQNRRDVDLQHSEQDLTRAVCEADLRPKAELAEASVNDYPRLWELLLRTNRYNCAVWRPDFAEFIDLAERADVTVWRGTCADDLVDYGTVCAAVVQHPARIRALTFSCRIGHRRFPWLLLDQLRAVLPPVEVTWGSDPAPRADPLTSKMRRHLTRR